MVKLGFIAEGATEKIILEKSDFFTYLNTLNIQYIPYVVDAKGNGNLLPHNIAEHSKILEDKGADKIVILTDLDEDKCITLTKDRISPLPHHTVTISIKQVEAWFLADTEAMRNLLGDSEYTCSNPESITEPFEEIHSLRMSKKGRGAGTKVGLANTVVHKYSFSIQRAAQHPNCPSATYFLNKIKQLATAS